MNVKTEERKTIVRTFAFDRDERLAFDMVAKLCESIGLGLESENANEMISNYTGEVLTYKDLSTAISVLDTLSLNDEMSWDLK